MNKLFYGTVTPLLLRVLQTLMKASEFEAFCLVGGTALSLHRGHRQSIDIDLFTDAEYGSINFDKIDTFLRATFAYVETYNFGVIGMGKSYFVGENKNDSVKLDLYYTDEFIFKMQKIDNIRLARVEEIIAMKLDVILRGGRKKDFWDIHNLIDDFILNQMLSFHQKRYPYTYDSDLIIQNLTQFINADNDFDPICLKGNHWELIKLDMIEFVNRNQ